MWMLKTYPLFFGVSSRIRKISGACRWENCSDKLTYLKINPWLNTLLIKFGNNMMLIGTVRWTGTNLINLSRVSLSTKRELDHNFTKLRLL